MIIHTYEKSIRAQTLAEQIQHYPEVNNFLDVVVLPIPSVKNGKITGTDRDAESLLSPYGLGSLVIGYAIPEDIKDALKHRGAVVCDSAYDEEFLLDNGELTAICALGIILTTEEKAPKDLSVGIVGYGRIGRALCKHLLFLGADTHIFTSRDTTRLELCEYGIATAMSASDADLTSLDILINTAPARIFNTEDENFPKELRVIDLASGDNFPNLKAVENYPSIPAKMFPKSAGKIWAKSVKRQLLNRGIYG